MQQSYYIYLNPLLIHSCAQFWSYKIILYYSAGLLVRNVSVTNILFSILTSLWSSKQLKIHPLYDSRSVATRFTGIITDIFCSKKVCQSQFKSYKTQIQFSCKRLSFETIGEKFLTASVSQFHDVGSLTLASPNERSLKWKKIEQKLQNISHRKSEIVPIGRKLKTIKDKQKLQLIRLQCRLRSEREIIVE